MDAPVSKFGAKPVSKFGAKPVSKFATKPAAPAAQPMQALVRGNGLPMELGQMTGETGKLSDPLEDRRAWLEAEQRRQFEKNRLQMPGQQIVDQGIDALLLDVDRPLEGAISGVGSLIRGEGFGAGYERGKAVNAYADEMRAVDNGLAGTAAGLAGSMLTPTGAGGLAKQALVNGLLSGVQNRAASTEGDTSVMDDLSAAGIGAGLTGVLGGVGRAISPGEITGAPLAQRQANESVREVLSGQGITTTERAGNSFRDKLVAEQGALKKEGSEAIARATGSDLTLTNSPGTRLAAAATTDYANVRTSGGRQPIPITPQGTPAAAALQEQILKVSKTSPDNLTLKQVDELRTQARGLRTQAANATDQAAIDDLNRSLDQYLDNSIKNGDFTGDPEFHKVYMAGRKTFEKAMSITDVPQLRNLLNNETIPGRAIADSLLSINTPSKSRNPAKIAAVLTEALGEGSESLAAVRTGVLANLMEDASDSPEAQKKLLNTLNKNGELLDSLFTPDQRAELAKIQVDLTRASDTAAGDATRKAAQTRFVRLLENTASQISKVTSAPGKTGLTVGAATQSMTAGAIAAATVLAAKTASNRGVRAAVGGSLQATAPAVARTVAQDPELQGSVSDARSNIINQLVGGPR